MLKAGREETAAGDLAIDLVFGVVIVAGGNNVSLQGTLRHHSPYLSRNK